VDKDSSKEIEEAVKKIFKYAKFYKVCEGCESVVIHDEIFCPMCDSYRFDSNIERVKKTAEILSKKEKTRILPGDFSNTQEFI